MTRVDLTGAIADFSGAGRALALALVSALLRLAPLAAFTPVFGGEAAPRRLRAGLVLVLAAGFAPALAGALQQGAALPALPILLLAAREFGVGALLALLVRAIFELVAGAGALIDLARGATLAQAFDPFTRERNSALFAFAMSLALALFAALGGHALLFRALEASYRAVPLAAGAPLRLSLAGALDAAGTAVAELFLAAVSFASPVLAVLFLVDVALGLIARAAGPVQLYFVGSATKGLLGILVLALVLCAGFPRFFERAFEHVPALFAGR